MIDFIFLFLIIALWFDFKREFKKTRNSVHAINDKVITFKEIIEDEQ